MSAPTLDQAQQRAAGELIAVTGDKTIKRTWDLADAIVAADPSLRRDVLQQIRDGAVAQAGHEEFWGVNRLRQIAKTAQTWPAQDRVPDVSLDAHMEVYRKKGSVADARTVILEVQKQTGGASIRDLRAALGANGTKAQPPRIDKAGIDEFWRRLTGRKDEFKKHLRGRLRVDRKAIVEFYTMFEELKDMLDKLDGAAVEAKAEPIETVATPVARKTRRKGI